MKPHTKLNTALYNEFDNGIGERMLKHVYLDLKDWIAIGKDFYKREIGETYSTELDWVLESVASGKICFPLVDTLFLEFFKRGNPIQRARLAKTMSLLSLGYLIADKRTRLAYEVRMAMAKMYKLPIPKPEDMIVRGLSRAFVADEAFANLIGINQSRLSQVIETMDNVDAWVDYFISVDEKTRKYLMDKFRVSNQRYTEMLESFRKSNYDDLELLLRTYYLRLFSDTQTTI